MPPLSSLASVVALTLAAAFEAPPHTMVELSVSSRDPFLGPDASRLAAEHKPVLLKMAVYETPDVVSDSIQTHRTLYCEPPVAKAAHRAYRKRSDGPMTCIDIGAK